MIIHIRRFGQGRAGGGFHRVDFNLFAVDLVLDKGKGQPGKIAAATGASNDHVRIFADFCHLFLGFQTDNRLMQHDMIEDAPQRVAGLA